MKAAAQPFSAADQFTGRTGASLAATPQIGPNQIFVNDQHDEFQDLRQNLADLRERHRKLESEWQKRLDNQKEQDHNDQQKVLSKHKEAE